MYNEIALFLFGFIGLVMLFAQLKLFSIEWPLKEILAELQERDPGS